jgi:hypothetical protein
MTFSENLWGMLLLAFILLGAWKLVELGHYVLTHLQWVG